MEASVFHVSPLVDAPDIPNTGWRDRTFGDIRRRPWHGRFSDCDGRNAPALEMTLSHLTCAENINIWTIEF
jgi:hypothetical protein